MIQVVQSSPWREYYTEENIIGLFIDIDKRFTNVDYTEFWKLLTAKLEETHKKHFQNEVDPSGKAWPPWYFRRFNSPIDHKTLDVSGRLRKSLLAGSSDHYQDITDRYLVWGSTVPYAGIHQFGASFILGVSLVGKKGEVLAAGKNINIPARPFVGISSDDFKSLVESVADQTVEFLKYKG